MLRKVLSIILGISLLFGFSISTHALSPEPNSLPNYEFYLGDEIYNSLNELADNDRSFAKQRKLLGFYNGFSDKIDEKQLGGAYFDENENLVIVLKENEYLKATRIYQEDVSYKLAKYSYEELQELQIIVNGLKEDIGFQGSGIDQEENKVNIYTDGKLNLELLYKTIPEDSIKLIIGDYNGTNCATYTVTPGTKITRELDGSYGTVSCGVVWDLSTSNPKYGFMTAGHLGNVADRVTYSGASMGTITKRQESGKVDAALIRQGQNTHIFNSSNKIPDGKTFSTNGGTWPKNTVIYNYGAKTGALKSGKITDTSYANTFDYISFTDLMLTDSYSQPGDSGAPVITAYGSDYSIIGIIKGLANKNDNNTMVFVKMENIKSAFDLNVTN